MSSLQPDTLNETNPESTLRLRLSACHLDFEVTRSALASLSDDLQQRRNTAWGLLMGSMSVGQKNIGLVSVVESMPLYSAADERPKHSLADGSLGSEDLVLG